MAGKQRRERAGWRRRPRRAGTLGVGREYNWCGRSGESGVVLGLGPVAVALEVHLELRAVSIAVQLADAALEGVDDVDHDLQEEGGGT